MAFGQQFEPQRARNWRCFYQTHVDHVPQSMHGTAAGADQGVAGLVILKYSVPSVGSGSGHRRRYR